MAAGVFKSFIRDFFAVKYNAETHDPESKRLDGNGRYYPNCASDVWLRSCEREIVDPLEGHVSGHIPKWLNGSLLRNGPGSWKVGDMTFGHLFDCSALLHRFAIKDGRVTYQNRFVDTKTLQRNRAAQRIVVTEFGTAAVPDPCHSIFDRFAAIFKPDSGTDNSMISIYPFGDEYYSFTETPFVHRINPRTLATEARLCITDYVGVVNHTSHPHVLPSGTVYNIGTTMTRTGPAYTVICFPYGEHMFEDAHVVATLPCRWKLHPGYMHTFGLTEHYFVIVEQPLSISLTEYIKAQLYGQNLCACLKWYEDKPTLFHLIDRATGKLCQTFESEAFFYLHIINAYEEDRHVVVDICCYKDPEMINCMYLEAIANMQTNPNYATLFRGRPLRFVLPLGSNLDAKNSSPPTCRSTRSRLVKSFSLAGLSAARSSQPSRLKHSESQYEDITYMPTNGKEASPAAEVKRARYDECVNLVTLENTEAQAFKSTTGDILLRPEMLCDWGCETPRIYYERYMGKKYRYFYAISSDVAADNPGTLIKVDVLTKTSKTWCEPNVYPSEPIFVPSPNAKSEDDGVLLAAMVVGGLNDRYVGLIVICARTMMELGRCDFHTNGPVPKCLHGWFAPQTA
ncbi:carotenoid isomerooxygenase [Scaptodrosophila lebanonensis]|uniref:Carotenoid isomerooxygenase n=1 Tax=Drosophila lebanonensis TaxID=7225 RepID=A0A6J2SZH0_DROLE|nr:carotenoid isomerooxygenase [Scaptodrosophila lebanonensis]